LIRLAITWLTLQDALISPRRQDDYLVPFQRIAVVVRAVNVFV
jgi:hypothetical protein